MTAAKQPRAPSANTAANAHEELSNTLLGQPYEALTPVQKSVIDLVVSATPTAGQPGLARDERTYWQRLADRVAAIGGSWNFIFGFGAALVLWIGWNVLTKGFGLSFDPYPFIFLNLMLSMLAAIQAPVIMMSQNRAAQKDREAAEHDYVVNLRAELEILRLHDKLDALRDQEVMHMVKCQNESLELLREQVGLLNKRLSD